jgi:hypothetical protein
MLRLLSRALDCRRLEGGSVAQIKDPDQPGRLDAVLGAAGADADTETRRQTIRRLGKYAAYTAPTMLAMLTATTAASGDSIPPP